MAEMQMQCLKKALKTCLENCALTSLAHCSSAKLSTEQCASSDDGGVIKTSTKFHQGFWPLCVCLVQQPLLPCLAGTLLAFPVVKFKGVSCISMEFRSVFKELSS